MKNKIWDSYLSDPGSEGAVKESREVHLEVAKQ